MSTEEQIKTITARIVDLQKIKEDAEKSANSLEAEARAQRKIYFDAKKEIGELTLALGHNRVISAVEQARVDAEKAKGEAEKTNSEAKQLLASLQKKQEELDALIKDNKKEEISPTE